jgi:membrane protein
MAETHATGRAGARPDSSDEPDLPILDRLPDWSIGELNLKRLTKETVAQIGDNDIPGLSAEMAYHSALAFFPFLLFLAGMAAVLDQAFGIENLTQRLIDQLDEFLSADAAAVAESVINEVRQSQGTGAAVLGFIGALWAGSAVIGSAIKGLNRIYDRKETRPMIPRKLLSIGLAVVFSLMLLAAAILIGAGELIAEALTDRLGLGTRGESLFALLAWPLSVLLVVGAVALLYWLGPAGEKQFKWVTPGAGIFAVGWLLASAIFALYLSNFNSYTTAYGALGAVIILLIWLYWSNFLLLIGAQVNFLIEQVRTGPTNDIEPKPKNTEAQP